MRPASFGIVFAAIFLSLLTVSDYRSSVLMETGLQRVMYNNCLDSAIEDAVTEIVEVDAGQQIQINKEKAVKDFFTALAVNFGVLEKPEHEKYLGAYVPAIAFVERDKLTLFYGFLGETRKIETFFQKQEGVYQISFTLTDYVFVENTKTGEALEGDFHDIGKVFPEQLFLEEELFYEEQRKVIRQVLIEHMESIIEEHNEAARKLGIKYRFFLPVIKGEEWYRSVDEISMLVFFQGYPYGNRVAGYYNRTAIGGAEIKKEKGIKYEKDMEKMEQTVDSADSFYNSYDASENSR